MNNDLPFIIDSKLSCFYYDNRKYYVMNNISYVYTMNHIIKHIALETYASYDSMYLTEKSAIDFEVDKIIFKNVTNQEELDYMYELMMLKQK